MLKYLEYECTHKGPSRTERNEKTQFQEAHEKEEKKHAFVPISVRASWSELLKSEHYEIVKGIYEGKQERREVCSRWMYCSSCQQKKI